MEATYYYHGLHMRIVHAWVRIIQHARRARFGRIAETLDFIAGE